MKKIFLLLCFIASMFLTSMKVYAQSEVVQREGLSQEIFDLQTSYRGELDEYRRYEREYQLAYDQNTKLQTLSSLETLVQATHKVMTTRSLVLHTYFRLMKLTIIDAEGINTQHKERLINSVDEAISRIETHRQSLEKSQNKTALQQAALEFEPLYEHLRSVAGYGQVVIQVGRLQNVYDNSTLLLAQIENEDISQLPAIQQSERQRAIEETKTSLQGVQSELQNANQDLEELSQRGADYYEIFYLPEVFDTLSKVLAFFEELT